MTPLSRLFWLIFELSVDRLLIPALSLVSMQSDQDKWHFTYLLVCAPGTIWGTKQNSAADAIQVIGKKFLPSLERYKTFLGVQTCGVKASASSTPRAKKRV